MRQGSGGAERRWCVAHRTPARKRFQERCLSRNHQAAKPTRARTPTYPIPKNGDCANHRKGLNPKPVLAVTTISITTAATNVTILATMNRTLKLICFPLYCMAKRVTASGTKTLDLGCGRGAPSMKYDSST